MEKEKRTFPNYYKVMNAHKPKSRAFAYAYIIDGRLIVPNEDVTIFTKLEHLGLGHFADKLEGKALSRKTVKMLADKDVRSVRMFEDDTLSIEYKDNDAILVSVPLAGVIKNDISAHVLGGSVTIPDFKKLFETLDKKQKKITKGMGLKVEHLNLAIKALSLRGDYRLEFRHLEHTTHIRVHEADKGFTHEVLIIHRNLEGN